MALSLLLLSACAATGSYFGSEASGARASDARTNASDTRTTSSEARTECEVTSPTVTPPLVTGGTLPQQPDVAPNVALAVLFGSSALDRSTYTVQIVDANGQPVASINAHLRSAITGTCGNDVQVFPAMPLMSASRGRVYYLDGDTDVRYLAADGSTGLATRLPGSSQSVAMFAVSPDDFKIAVSVFDYRQHPVAARLYVRELDGRNRIGLPESDIAYRWPVGWHDGKLLVGSDGTASPMFGFYGALPYRLTGLELLDPTSGRIVANLARSHCLPQSSLPTPAGFACATSGLAVGRIDWSGNATIFANADAYTGGASLSPDGTQLLASGTGALLKLIDSPETGSTSISLGSTYPQGGGYPHDGGWLDPFHVVYRVAGTSDQVVIDVRNKAIAPLPANAVLVARLPGGY